MESWDLFLKGLARTFEEFSEKMIEKGRGDEIEKPVKETVESAPRPTVKKRKIPRRDLGDLEDKLIDAVSQFPLGCTLKEIAKTLGVQWHYLRIPLRQLVLDGKILKDEKIYTLPRVANMEAPEPALAEVPEYKETPVSVPVQAATPVRTSRRRVVDAKKLDMPPQMAKPAMPEMSTREKEILRFKILTAFRGRPEGLTVNELAAVLGRSSDGLDGVINELLAEKKVVQGKANKYRLT